MNLFSFQDVPEGHDKAAQSWTCIHGCPRIEAGPKSLLVVWYFDIIKYISSKHVHKLYDTMTCYILTWSMIPMVHGNINSPQSHPGGWWHIHHPQESPSIPPGQCCNHGPCGHPWVWRLSCNCGSRGMISPCKSMEFVMPTLGLWRYTTD